MTLTWSSGKISSCRCITFLNLASGCFSEDLRSAIYSALLLEPTSNESYSTFLTDSNIFSHILISTFEPWGRAKTFKYKSKRALIRFLTLTTQTSHGTSILIPNESSWAMFSNKHPGYTSWGIYILYPTLIYLNKNNHFSLFSENCKGYIRRAANEWMNEFSAMWSWHVIMPNCRWLCGSIWVLNLIFFFQKKWYHLCLFVFFLDYRVWFIFLASTAPFGFRIEFTWQFVVCSF